MIDDSDKEKILNSISGSYFIIEQLHLSRQLSERAEMVLKTKPLEPDQLLDFHAYLSTAIIEYSKLFTGSGKGKITLSKHDTFKGQGELLTLHEEVMNLRNEFIAHNGNHEAITENITITERRGEIIVSFGATSRLQNQILPKLKLLVDFLGKEVGPLPIKKMKKLSKHLGITVRPPKNQDEI